jgi:hypothetical protein
VYEGVDGMRVALLTCIHLQALRCCKCCACLGEAPEIPLTIYDPLLRPVLVRTAGIEPARRFRGSRF